MNSQTLTLDSLPTEVFLYICSFLKANFVINVLGKVCQRFNDIIEEDYVWKTRIFLNFPKKYPLIADESFDWKKACVEREEQYSLWSNHENKMNKFILNAAHFASVDVVKIIKAGTFCASGSRDHSLRIWDLSKVKFNVTDFSEALQVLKPEAHNGWIWSIVEGEDRLYTGSWDTTIKGWDINSSFTPTINCSLESANLCLDYNDNVLAAGSYRSRVHLFDVRCVEKKLLELKLHSRAVLCVSLTDKYVISGSEDGTIVIYDRRADKLLKRKNLRNFPMCLSYGLNQLWVGDKGGEIHLFNPQNGLFNRVGSYDTGHTGKITGICHSLGSIITSSMDKSIRVLEPSDTPSTMALIPLTNQIGCISTYENILVSANSDSSIGVWLPKEEL